MCEVPGGCGAARKVVTGRTGLPPAGKRADCGGMRFETRSRSVSDAAVLAHLCRECGLLKASFHRPPYPRIHQVPASSNGSDYLYTSGFVCHREDVVHYGC